jgi:hypothetical protein
MKRALKTSEKLLLGVCVGTIALIVTFFAWRNHRQRLAAAREKIESLEPKLQAAVAAAADAPFWEQRQQWLEATMPPRGDSGVAHGHFLDQLQTSAGERGLALASPVLLKPESGPRFSASPRKRPFRRPSPPSATPT